MNETNVYIAPTLGLAPKTSSILHLLNFEATYNTVVRLCLGSRRIKKMARLVNLRRLREQPKSDRVISVYYLWVGLPGFRLW